MPSGKLQPCEKCLNNLKFVHEKMPLKVSSFLKNDYLTDYIIRTEHATEKLNCMKRRHERPRNE